MHLARSLHAPDIRAKLEAAGMVVMGNSAEEFAAVMRAQIEAYRKLTTALG